MIVTSSSFKRSFLLRFGDSFLAPPLSAFGLDPVDNIEKFKHLHVMKTTPLEQGIVTINTSFVVIQKEVRIFLLLFFNDIKQLEKYKVKMISSYLCVSYTFAIKMLLFCQPLLMHPYLFLPQLVTSGLTVV